MVRLLSWTKERKNTNVSRKTIGFTIDNVKSQANVRLNCTFQWNRAQRLTTNFNGDELNAYLCSSKPILTFKCSQITYEAAEYHFTLFIHMAFNGLLVSLFQFVHFFSLKRTHSEYSIFVYIDFPNDFT